MILYCARHLLPIGSPGIEDGALLVEGGRIAAAGSRRELAAAHPGSTLVDFGEAVILPPLTNAHTHLELTDFPVWAEASGQQGEQGDFADWILHLVRVRRAVGDAEVANSLRHGLQQCLQAGTGVVGDILSTLPAVAAYAGSPLRGRVFAEVLGVDQDRVDSRLADIAVQLAVPPGAFLRWGLSPHAPYTLAASTLAGAVVFALNHRLPIAMHWAETVEELDFLDRASGPLAEKLYPTAGWKVPPPPAGPGRPAHRALLPGSLLIHGVHAAADDIDAVAAAGHGVVLCPRSNSRFGLQRAPLSAYRRAGVPLALGTDSRASSPSLSIWEELAFARQWFAGSLAPADWLSIATAGGASVLGLSGQVGHLVAGGEASFQVVALPDGATAASIEEALVSGGGGIDVRALYLAGEEIPRSTAQPINHFTK